MSVARCIQCDVCKNKEILTKDEAIPAWWIRVKISLEGAEDICCKGELDICSECNKEEPEEMLKTIHKIILQKYNSKKKKEKK